MCSPQCGENRKVWTIGQGLNQLRVSASLRERLEPQLLGQHRGLRSAAQIESLPRGRLTWVFTVASRHVEAPGDLGVGQPCPGTTGPRARGA